MTTKKEKERQEAIEYLRELLPPGSSVYTVHRHTSRSGMTHDIDVYTWKGNVKLYLSRWVATAMDWKCDVGRSRGVRMGGCGMDMGFHLINCLSYALHGMKNKGGALRAMNAGQYWSIVHKTTPHSYRAGYSLHHKWI